MYTFAKRVMLLTIKDLTKKQFSLHDLFEVTNEAMDRPVELDLDVSFSNLLIATTNRKWTRGKISSVI